MASLRDELATAAWNGNLAQVKRLVERGAPVDGGFSNGHHSALNGAARNGHAEIVAFLLEREPRPDIESRCQAPWSVTPLQQAAYHGRAECARLLLRHGASTSSKSGPGCGHKCAKDIALEMRNGQWRELVEAIDAPATTVVMGTVIAQNASSSTGAVVVEPGGVVVVDAATSAPPLAEMAAAFKAELGVSGNMIDIVNGACDALGVEIAGLNVLEKARKCWTILFGEAKPPVATAVAAGATTTGATPTGATPNAKDVASALLEFQWNAGKPCGGPENFGANPWRFNADSTFVTERDGCNGVWNVRFEENEALGAIVLRMDWRADQAGNYAEFVLEPGGIDASPAFRARDASYGFMRSWTITQRDNQGGRRAAPAAPNRGGGTWTQHSNIDMCGQGDVEIIGNWTATHSIDDLKRMVETKGYSAFTVSPGQQSFGHAALKKFDFALNTEHCKPTGYSCTIYIYTPPTGRPGLLKLESAESVDGVDGDGLRTAIDGMGRLQLVPKGSPLALKLDNASALREGREVPLTAAGQNVGLFWEGPRNAWGHWDYIDLGVSDEVRPLTVKLEGPYLVWRGPHGEMVFDVSMWRLEAGNHLVAVKACPGNPGGPTRMSKDAAGRDFVLNADGTVSPRNARHLCLGHAGAPVLNALVLVRGDSKNKCIFDKAALRSGRPTPLTLVSHPGLAIAKRYADERRAGEWRYIESGVAKAPHAIRAVLTRDGFIELPGENLVLDIAFWKFDEGNTVNFVGGSSAGRTKIQDGPAGRSWVLNEDGSVSTRSRSDLFLGVADKGGYRHPSMEESGGGARKKG